MCFTFERGRPLPQVLDVPAMLIKHLVLPMHLAPQVPDAYQKPFPKSGGLCVVVRHGEISLTRRYAEAEGEMFSDR